MPILKSIEAPTPDICLACCLFQCEECEDENVGGGCCCGRIRPDEFPEEYQGSGSDDYAEDPLGGSWS